MMHGPARNAAAAQSPGAGRAPLTSREDPIQQLGVYVLMLFIASAYLRLTEHLPVPIHLPLILSALLTLFLVGTAGFMSGFRSKPAVLLGVFGCWAIVASMVGMSRWESLTQVSGYGMSFLGFLGVTGLVRTLRQLRKVCWLVAACGCTIAVMAIFYGEEKQGRLEVSGEGGTLSNPNDTALYLLFGLPFCVLVAADTKRSALVRGLAGVGSAAVIYATFRTGSRMGLIGLLVATLLFVLHGSIRRALLTVVALCIGTALTVSMMPEGAAVRYRAMLESREEILGEQNSGEAQEKATETQLNWASGSAVQRTEAIWAGIRLTLQHPLFGVGPGQFGAAMNKEKNRMVRWLQPHNTYTQLSSETGVLGAFLYVWAVICSMRLCYRTYKATRKRPDLVSVSRLAYGLFASLIIMGTVTMFSHIAYGIMFPLLCGLAVVVARVCTEDPALSLGPGPLATTWVRSREAGRPSTAVQRAMR
jgi:O-antigen ligase